MKWARTCAGFVAAAVAVPMLFAGPASATGSIAGTDSQADQVGSALATCAAFAGSASAIQSDVYAFVPGKGVVLGQSFYFQNRRNEMVSYLASGWSPSQIIRELKRVNSITSPDRNAPLYEDLFAGAEGNALLQRRQYLIAAIGETPNGFTGNSDEPGIGTPEFRKNVRATDLTFGRWRAAIGGNTLTGNAVVKGMKNQWITNVNDPIVVLETLLGIQLDENDPVVRAKFRKRDLAERLFLSLAAGFRNGEGDSRCTSLPGLQSKSSNLAWVRVDGSNGGTPVMNLRYSSNNPDHGDAVKTLAFLYFSCRNSPTTANCNAAVEL